MESLRIFDDFKFGDLDKEWIQSVWDGEFMIYDEPPDEYFMFIESHDMMLLLTKSCNVIRTCLGFQEFRTENGVPRSENNSSELSWSTLITLDVNVRALLPILGYIIQNGQNKTADDDSRQLCVLAINLYFMLLAVPGSNVFNIFHPNLYQRAVQTLEIFSEQLQPLTRKRSRTMSFGNPTTNNDSTNETVILSSIEKKFLAKELNSIIYNFIDMTKSFAFKDHMQSLNITLRGLIDVTKTENDLQSFNRKTDTSEISLIQNAYMALNELCNKKHGPLNVTISLIAKYMLPRLLCSHMDPNARFLTNVREHSINFLNVLLQTYKEEAKIAILTLIQCVILRCPDRLEGRQKQASVVLKLFEICTENILLKALKDLALLSHHSKIHLRLFAQEIIGKLLLEPFLTNCNFNDTLKVQARRVFFTIVLNRCMDCSNTVRGKAMAIIAEFSESANKEDKEIFQIIFKESDTNKKFVAFCDMKDNLFKNVDLLPGSNAFISMLKDRIEDERALVRRSSLQILKNLIIMFPFLIQDTVSVMSIRCRDPALLVRRFAVQVLSQLLQKFPDNTELLDSWVQTAVPQVFDVEVKVQEKVLEYLEELLLHRIKNISTSNDSTENNLPWKILSTLVNMKMQKHLSKVCNLWIKNGIVKNSIILNIQSHIGTSNDIEAWIFLVALAENINLPNMSKYFSNYKEIFKENNFHTSLVLQVLRSSWKSIDREILESLYNYLYKLLEELKINYELISICLDIIHNLTHYLDPDNNSLESRLLNLIKISETEITKIFQNEDQAIEAAPNYLKALFTLGHATILCTCRISPSTLRILEGVLVNWESLPESIKELKELQASAVIFLGQQAMRDRKIAKEVTPIFGKLMTQEADINSNSQIAVKINVAKALADICIRFTALVEPYLPDMCVSMKHSSPQVREAIVVIFIQLLLEEYIKLKGPFFFHILTMLSDSDDTIRELTIFLMEERLLTKNKSLISQQFLRSIYHYNNYQIQHRVYHHKMSEKEEKALTLPRTENEKKRRTIYDFMLDHLDPPGKIRLLVKITSQILGGTCADMIDIKKEEGACVLKDALYVVSNDRLRPSSFNKQTNDDDQDGEESAARAIAPTSNAINIIVEGIKTHGLEVLLPVLIKLKIKLSNLKSPLECDVKRVLVKTYSEYNKDQLLNILNEYPKLEKEVEQFKKQEGNRFSEDNSVEEETFMSETNNHSSIFNTTLGLSALDMSLRAVSKTPVNCISPTSIDGWSPLMCSTPILSSSIPQSPQPGPSTSRLPIESDNENKIVSPRKIMKFCSSQNKKKHNDLQHRIRSNHPVQYDSESD